MPELWIAAAAEAPQEHVADSEPAASAAPVLSNPVADVAQQGDPPPLPRDAVSNLAGIAKSSGDDAAEVDDGTLLFERLNTARSYDFEALAAYFDAQAAEKNATLTAQQVAASWARVRAYANALVLDGVADDMSAAALWSG